MARIIHSDVSGYLDGEKVADDETCVVFSKQEFDRIQKDIEAHANVCLSEENDRLIDAMQKASKLIWSHPIEAEQILARALKSPRPV